MDQTAFGFHYLTSDDRTEQTESPGTAKLFMWNQVRLAESWESESGWRLA